MIYLLVHWFFLLLAWVCCWNTVLYSSIQCFIFQVSFSVVLLIVFFGTFAISLSFRKSRFPGYNILPWQFYFLSIFECIIPLSCSAECLLRSLSWVLWWCLTCGGSFFFSCPIKTFNHSSIIEPGRKSHCLNTNYYYFLIFWDFTLESKKIRKAQL